MEAVDNPMTISMPDISATDSSGTIAAISTPPGEGGVGIVRLSGPRALAIASSLFASSRGIALETARQRVFYGHVRAANGEPIDEVLLHVMRAPHSYTREDVVEINAHGGAAPLHAILEETLRAGARLAHPGEFTMRAFLNGRIDLVQAEAVIDVIRARTTTALHAAQSAASGTLSKEIHTLRGLLVQALAQIEASLDFPEEDLPALLNTAVLARLAEVGERMDALLATAENGRLCREGASAAIVGRPNVGKSSLFNALLRDARAIVSEHAGTTRDRIEEYINLAGIPVKLIDTAGVRDTGHEIERLGVERAREALRTSQLILFVLDASAPDTQEDRDLADELAAQGTPVTVVLNKIDLAPNASPPSLPFNPTATIPTSAQTGIGIGALEDALAQQLLGGASLATHAPLLTRTHQTDSLRRARCHLIPVLDGSANSPELMAVDLREALQALGEITGETTPEDILGLIFSSFCIGK